MPWEYVVAVANQADRDLWVCLPALADNDYITRLIRLVHFGSDGVNPYTAPQAAQVPAFWAGGSSWRVRFAGPMPGWYAFRCPVGQGEFKVHPYDGTNPLFKHGSLRVSDPSENSSAGYTVSHRRNTSSEAHASGPCGSNRQTRCR
jgi:hypothetical protein